MGVEGGSTRGTRRCLLVAALVVSITTVVLYSHFVSVGNSFFDLHAELKLMKKPNHKYTIIQDDDYSLPNDVQATSASKQSICHNGKVVSNSISKRSKSSILVFGASTFLGSRIAMYLHNRNYYKVKPIDDLYDISSLEPLAWYRWQKLMQQKMKPEFVDMNSINKIISANNIGSVLFVPSHLFDGYSTGDQIVELKQIKRVLHNFVDILNSIVSQNRNIQVTLLSTSKKSLSMQNSWLKSLELSLSSYQSLHGLQVRLIRMDGVYGPWEDEKRSVESYCIHIGAVERAVFDMLEQQEDCIDIDISEKCVKELDKMNETMAWVTEYRKFLSRRKDVVFSTYLVHSPNPIYSYQTKPNSCLYMRQWFLSAVKLNLSFAIGNDNFNEDFKNRIRHYHPNTDFMTVNRGLNGRSTNDYRFYAFYQYLLQHPEINRAFLTDMRDVRFYGDPFEKMDVIGNEYLYIGTSVPFYFYPNEHPWVSSIIRNCHRSDSKLEEMKLHPHLNAGVLGGTRSLLLAFLTQMIRYFDKSPHGLNCNMGTIAVVAHKHFNDLIFAGYPIQSAFKILTAGNSPQGLAIKHKDTF